AEKTYISERGQLYRSETPTDFRDRIRTGHRLKSGVTSAHYPTGGISTASELAGRAGDQAVRARWPPSSPYRRRRSIPRGLPQFAEPCRRDPRTSAISPQR